MSMQWAAAASRAVILSGVEGARGERRQKSPLRESLPTEALAQVGNECKRRGMRKPLSVWQGDDDLVALRISLLHRVALVAPSSEVRHYLLA